MGNINISFNSEKNGIELRFGFKPSIEILAVLKQSGFRWSNRQKMWYAKQNERTIGVANSLSNGEDISVASTNKTTTKCESLWTLTRTDGIENHVDKAKETKEIAAEVRKHVKARFPMCKISITSDYNSVDADIKASPFDKESEELKAIRDYITAYIKSYKYCIEYDPYGDYGSSYNFYFSGCDIHYRYIQTEMTVAIAGMSDEFKKEKQAFEIAEQERFLKECEENARQRRIEHEKLEKLRIENEAKRDAIQSAICEKDVEYFVEGLIDYGCRKQNTVDEYTQTESDDEIEFHTCKVSKEIHLTDEQFDFFENHLMMDWGFIAGTGGSCTDDLRINSMIDYDMMSAEERNTVEWYDCNCVAIFCNDIPMLVVDTQGYDYCRYVYFFGDNTKIVKEHHSYQAISEEEKAAYAERAEDLIDASTSIIVNNNLIGRWNDSDFDTYKELLKNWIYEHDFCFNVNLIRAIDEDRDTIKRAFYKVFQHINSVQEQFNHANLMIGQRVTIIKMDNMMGGLTTYRAVIESVRNTSYAQYDDAVELVIRPEHKRNMYKLYIYDDVLVYDGWLDTVPNSLFYDVVSRNNGIVVSKGKYMSFDHEQYNAVFEYYKNMGALPIVDTRKN